jgi:GT2 family glycosyltransferase
LKQKLCIVILGMHRSGTSVVAGAINLLEVDFGKTLMLPSFDNPKGFFENEPIVRLNDKILSLLNRKWDSLPELPDGWYDLPKLKGLYSEGHAIIASEFSSAALFAIKDPRLSLLWPFWAKIFTDLAIECKFIINIRDPFATARSLGKRNHFTFLKSHLLIQFHQLSAEKNTRNTQRSFLDYDSFIQEPIDELARIIKVLDIDLSISDKSKVAILNHIIPAHSPVKDIVYDHSDQKIISSGMETYTILHRADTKISEIDRDRLDQLWERYHLSLQEYPQVIKEDPLFAQLFVKTQSGLDKGRNLSRSIEGDHLIWEIDFEFTKEKIQELCIVPMNRIVNFRIDDLTIDSNQMDYSYEIRSNAIREKGNIFQFDMDQPRIFIVFKSPILLNSFKIKGTFLSIQNESDEVTIKSLSPNRNSGPLWLQAIITATLNPATLLKNINKEKIRTLRSALKRENPRQIIRNFIKLLRRQKSQEELESNLGIDRRKKSNFSPVGHMDLRSYCKIIYVVPSIPEFDTSSGGRRASRIIELMSSFAEIIIFSSYKTNLKYQEYFLAKGIEVIDNFNFGKLKSEHPKVYVVIYAWYYTWYDAQKLRDIYPTAQHIIDSVDIHWVREERSVGLQLDLTADRVLKNKIRELQAYKEADSIWVVSDPDRQALLSELPDQVVDLISNVHEPKVRSYRDSGNNNILFLGSYTHRPNVSAVIWIAHHIFPLVKARVPDAQLIIAGAHAPDEVEELGSLIGISYLGYIEEEDLEALYKNTFLCLSPLLSGAGIKGKICEAISYAVPVVTNTIGNEGIGLVHETSGLIAENAEGLANLIIQGLNRDFDFLTIVSNAQNQIKKLVAPPFVKASMLSSVFKPIDICIVSYNRMDLLQRCIESIFAHTIYPIFNLLVYSNGCTDGTQEYLLEMQKKHSNVIPILEQENDVFVRPNNKMMRMHPQHDVVLVNNDVEVSDGWLIGLNRTAYSLKGIGIVGAKILNFDGTLQEFGSEIYEDGKGINYGKGDDNAYRNEYEKAIAVPYVSGCAIYIKRTTIAEIGVFDDQYHPCYYEDSDYCYTAWRENIMTVVSPDSVVYHAEGSTSGTNEELGYKRYQRINAQKFSVKHQDSIAQIRNKVRKLNKQIFEKEN